MNWTDISNNPVDAAVHKFLYEELLKKRGNIADKIRFIKAFVQNKSVLDIGVVEHDISHINSENWKHRKIKQWAEMLVGVDILQDEVEYLNANGYDIRLIDATSEVDLGVRFDRVVIGDVIEHVSEPINLLRFASRHIKDDGLIMVSTPNPFYYKFIYRVFKESTFIANAEHISWVTPTMAIEIAKRAGLHLDSYSTVTGVPNSVVKKLLKYLVSKLIGQDNELFTAEYVYCFSRIK